MVLESHYYAWCLGSRADCNASKQGFGPFFAIVPSNDTIVAFGLGLMHGWRTADTKDSSGFSIGVGAVLDAEVESLAKGFEVGRPPPPGETTVKTEKKSKWSALVFFTRTF